MRYDFDEIIDRRNTNAMKTDGFRQYMFHGDMGLSFPYRDDELIPMWVADMEFAAAPEICQAMKERVDRRIFGYTKVYDSEYYKALLAWCRQRYDWEFGEEELVFSDGVVSALYQLSEILTGRTKKMLTFTPAYSQFRCAADYAGVELVHSPLIEEKGRFSIDFGDLERKAADEEVNVLLLCNPHNPTGRIWTRGELERIADIAQRHELWVISDEIHCDILRQGLRHIPMGKIMPVYPRLITCMAPSKTFNLAGLRLSSILIRDPEVRESYYKRDKGLKNVNPISLEACKAAYHRGGEWLDRLKEYLDENFHLVKRELNRNLPKTNFQIPESTYLAWVDFSEYLSDVEDIPMFFAKHAGVLLEGGDSLFVGNAKGHARLNLAMPRKLLQTGMERICKAVKEHAEGGM